MEHTVPLHDTTRYLITCIALGGAFLAFLVLVIRSKYLQWKSKKHPELDDD